MVTNPLRSVVYGLSDGEHNGSVVAVNPYNAAVLHLIRVGRMPSGIAFSPDGSEIYVASSIAPETREVTRTIEVPGSNNRPGGTFPGVRVAAGRAGRLYHVNGAEDPLLRACSNPTARC